MFSKNSIIEMGRGGDGSSDESGGKENDTRILSPKKLSPVKCNKQVSILSFINLWKTRDDKINDDVPKNSSSQDPKRKLGDDDDDTASEVSKRLKTEALPSFQVAGVQNGHQKQSSSVRFDSIVSLHGRNGFEVQNDMEMESEWKTSNDNNSQMSLLPAPDNMAEFTENESRTLSSDGSVVFESMYAKIIPEDPLEAKESNERVFDYFYELQEILDGFIIDCSKFVDCENAESLFNGNDLMHENENLTHVKSIAPKFNIVNPKVCLINQNEVEGLFISENVMHAIKSVGVNCYYQHNNVSISKPAEHRDAHVVENEKDLIPSEIVNEVLNNMLIAITAAGTEQTELNKLYIQECASCVNDIVITALGILAEDNQKAGPSHSFKVPQSRSPSPETPDGEYEVEQILDFAKGSKNLPDLYLVKWKGYSEEDNTWEPLDNMDSCVGLLYTFYLKRKEEIRVLKESKKSVKLDLPPDPRPFIERVNAFLDPNPVEKSEVDWALEKISKGKKYLWNEIKTEKSMREAKAETLPDDKVCRLRKQLVYRHVMGKKSDVNTKLQEWCTSLNQISKGMPMISVENGIDLAEPPSDFTYINDYITSGGIVIPDDPPVGCECTGGCYNNQKDCCPSNNDVPFAYTTSKRLKTKYPVNLMYECNRKCTCDEDCPNRVVKDGVTPLKGLKMCIYRTKGCGWGVKTLKPIKRGTFVCMYVGEIINTEEAERRGKVYDQDGTTYLFDLDFNQKDCPYTVDAAYHGNISHFMNHSCDPNLAVYGVWVNCLDPNLPKLALFAERDIAKNEELCFDYKSQSRVPDPDDEDLCSNEVPLIKQQQCLCGSAKCRKILF